MTSTQTPSARLLFEWALEQLVGRCGHALNPDTLFAELRHGADANDPLLAFERAAASQRLTVTRVSVTASAVLGDAPLPLVVIDQGAPILLVERRGRQVQVLRGPDDDRWCSDAALEALLGEAPVTALHCAPSTPAEALSAHGHELTPWQRLWAWMRLERDDLFVVVIYSAIVGVLSLATPIAVQSLVGTVAFGTLVQPIVVLALLFFFALAFQATLKALKAWVIEALQARLFARVSLDLAYRLPRTSRTDATPELVNRFFDVVTSQKTIANLLTEGLSSVMQITVGCLVLAFYHPALLALDLVLLLGTLAFVLLPLRRGLSTAFEESSAKYEVAGWLEELTRVPDTFRSSSGAALAVTRADALTRRYLAARRRHFTVVFSQVLSALVVQVLVSAVLLGFGGYLVIRGSLTLGQLIAAEFIVATVTARITGFGKLLEATYDLLVGLTKVGHLIDLELGPERPGEQPRGDGPVSVSLERVDAPTGPLTTTIAAGAKVALPSTRGSGLADVLAGNTPPGGGVSIDGVDLRELDHLGWRDAVALVRLEAPFAGTIADNVAPDGDASRVRDALERAGLASFVRSLPEGTQTVLDVRGAPLSLAQQLQLSVARALAKAPRLVIVEDALDVLDEADRRRVIEALTGPKAPWTLIALVGDGHSALARACRLRAAHLDEAS